MPLSHALAKSYNNPLQAREDIRKAIDDPANQDRVRMTVIAMYADGFGERELALAAMRRAIVEFPFGRPALVRLQDRSCAPIRASRNSCARWAWRITSAPAATGTTSASQSALTTSNATDLLMPANLQIALLVSLFIVGLVARRLRLAAASACRPHVEAGGQCGPAGAVPGRCQPHPVARGSHRAAHLRSADHRGDPAGFAGWQGARCSCSGRRRAR